MKRLLQTVKQWLHRPDKPHKAKWVFVVCPKCDEFQPHEAKDNIYKCSQCGKQHDRYDEIIRDEISW